jgi:hypothetical protein
VQLQSEFPHALPQFLQEPLGFVSILEPQHGVIRISGNDYTARCFLPPPLMCPEIEYLM